MDDNGGLPALRELDALGRRSMLMATSAIGRSRCRRRSSPETKAQDGNQPASIVGNDGPAKQAILDFVHSTTDQAQSEVRATLPSGSLQPTKMAQLWVEHPIPAGSPPPEAGAAGGQGEARIGEGRAVQDRAVLGNRETIAKFTMPDS